MMERKKINIEELPRGNSYKVPEGYFSDLNHRIAEKVESHEQAEGIGLGKTLRRLSGFAVGFAAMALMAVVGFYFTGYRAQQQEQMSMTTEDFFFNVYHVTVDDILETGSRDSGSDADFVEAAYAYLDTFGYSSADIAELYEHNIN